MQTAIAARPDAVQTLPAEVEAEYPSSVFGRRPAGFVLEQQSIHMLAHWHRKSLKAIDESPATDEEFSARCTLARRLLEAILGAKTRLPSEVAVQMSAAIETINAEDNNSIEEVLDVEDFRRLAANLASATAPLRPTKCVGALNRGRKLTRAGLLHRYHAFLIEELNTVGSELYGSRDYPKYYQPFDDAVNKRCRNSTGKHPFFDPRKLPYRASTVLKSLKIDTEHYDDVARKSRKAAD